MKPDEFEKRLQRQMLRPVPAGWRNEILAAAAVQLLGAPKRNEGGSTLNALLSTLLWPHPKAWAGLAAAWMVILAVNFSIRDQAPVVAEKAAPPAPEIMVELKQQRRLLAELIGPRDAPVADRSKPLVPQPHTRRGEFMTA
jgi:hypothetical protein